MSDDVHIEGHIPGIGTVAVWAPADVVRISLAELSAASPHVYRPDDEHYLAVWERTLEAWRHEQHEQFFITTDERRKQRTRNWRYQEEAARVAADPLHWLYHDAPSNVTGRHFISCMGCGAHWWDNQECECECSPGDPRAEEWHSVEVIL